MSACNIYYTVILTDDQSNMLKELYILIDSSTVNTVQLLQGNSTDMQELKQTMRAAIILYRFALLLLWQNNQSLLPTNLFHCTQLTLLRVLPFRVGV